MSRRQLEFEARHIRSAMEEQLGSCQEMERRAQVCTSCLDSVMGRRVKEDRQFTWSVCAFVFPGTCVPYSADRERHPEAGSSFAGNQ